MSGSNGSPKTLLQAEDLKIHYPIHGGVLLKRIGEVKAIQESSSVSYSNPDQTRLAELSRGFELTSRVRFTFALVDP